MESSINFPGERIRLRPMVAADLPFFVRPVSAGFSTPADRQQATERFEQLVRHNPSLRGDGFESLVVESDGVVVGDIQARAPRQGFPPGVCELGINLFAGSRGRGLGTEAVRLFTAHLFEDGWQRVQAATSVSNNGMRRVLERTGYGLEGVLRSYAPSDVSGRDDYVLYAALASWVGSGAS